MSKKVCIDAGHFGKYNRSPVNPAYYESVQMWELQEYLSEALLALGIEVRLTRKREEEDMPLLTRGRMAKGCDLFLSLHSNAAGSERVDYPVAYVRDEPASAEIGLWLAQTVENVMGTRQSGRTATRSAGGDRDGNGKKDDEYYGVLQGAKEAGVPGVILEHSFHTNKKAAAWLLSSENLKKMARAEAEIIARWLGVDIQEEESDMTQEQFNSMIETWLRQQGEKPATWEQDAMAAAKAAGLMDGARPKALITRGEVAQILKNAKLS